MQEDLEPNNAKNIDNGRRKPGGFLGLTMELAAIVVGAFLFAFVIRSFVIQPFFVKGQSMEPNYLDHEYLIINEIGCRFKGPVRGDVIVFKYPKDPSTYFIKRVVALPNETISIKNGKIVIYNDENKGGFELEEPYLAENIFTAGDVYAVLGNGEYYVLGDNRPHSSDSRQWGALDERYVIGKAWIRIWPLNQLSIIN